MTPAMELGQYRTAGGGYDEVVDAAGAPRANWLAVVRSLGSLHPGALIERQRQTDRLLDAEGTGHLVHEITLATDRHGHSGAARAQSRPWRLDPIPFVLDGSEFETLAAGARQRMRAVEAVLADCYGDRRLVADGVLPASLLHSLHAYRPTLGGLGASRWLVHYAVDLARDAQGQWRVVQDLADAPSGLGYALLNRAVLARVVSDAVRLAEVASVNQHADVLRRALTATAPTSRHSPRAVVLSAGPSDATYIEHSYLATRLGIHLVEGADVVMRAGRMWLRVLDGVEPIDVVYRRIDDAHLDPLEPAHHGGGVGVPGLVWGARASGVVMANAYGSGLAETAAFREFLPAATAHLMGEALALPAHRDNDGLATSPVLSAVAAQLDPRPVVLRLHLARVGDDIVVMPGGNGRVLAPGDHPTHPTEQIAKDVWVVGRVGGQSRPVLVSAPPQVDFASSVPKRVADALYWLGRAAERAEVAARATRVVNMQLEQDPALVGLADGGWAHGAHALLRAAQAAPAAAAPPGVSISRSIHVELDRTKAVVVAQLASLVQEAASVREYLSTTTGRVLGRLASAYSVLSDEAAPADELDVVLVDLAALSGLVMESTVRGPAWRFLDLGRRLERALAVVGAVEAALGPATAPLALQPIADAVLGANESLVAYRRSYRSEVDLQAVLDLLLRDDTNPRSLAYQLDRLREHVAGLGWSDGVQLVQAASVASLATVAATEVNGRRVSLDSYVLAVRAPLLQLADAIVHRWFADPVNPTIVRGQ